MLGRLWSDTVSRVRLTAVEVQQQVTQKAAKAREVFGIYRLCTTTTQLEQSLLTQASQVKSLSSLHELCWRWIRELKDSGQPTCVRYIESDAHTYASVEAKASPSTPQGKAFDAKNVASRGSSSQLNVDISHTELGNSMKLSPSFDEASTEATTIITEMEKAPVTSTDSHYIAETLLEENPPRSANYETFTQKNEVTTGPSTDESIGLKLHTPQNMQTLSDVSNAFSETGLTFRQVFLRSKTLERLILCVFKNSELLKEFLGSLEESSTAQPVRESLLKLFQECLRCDEKINREIISLLMTMDINWKGHVEWVAIVVSVMKVDWVDDRLQDLRNLMAAEVSELSLHLRNRVGGSLMKFEEDQATAAQNALMHQNIRVMASRKLVQLYQLIEANMLESAERRRSQLIVSTGKLKMLTDKMNIKEERYMKKVQVAIESKAVLQKEYEQISGKMTEYSKEIESEYRSFDSELLELEKKRNELTAALEEVAQKIDKLEGIKKSKYQEIEQSRKKHLETQLQLQGSIMTESRNQSLNEQQQADARNIASVASQSKDLLFRIMPLHAKRISDDSYRLKEWLTEPYTKVVYLDLPDGIRPLFSFRSPTAALLQQHFLYEKERLLHQSEVIQNYCYLLSEFAKNPTDTFFFQQSTASSALSHSQSLNPKPYTEADKPPVDYKKDLLVALSQLDIIWAEVHAFASSCGNLLKMPPKELEMEEVNNFSLKEVLGVSSLRNEGSKADLKSEHKAESDAPTYGLASLDFKALLDELETLYVNVRSFAAPFITQIPRAQPTSLDLEASGILGDVEDSDVRPSLDIPLGYDPPIESSDLIDGLTEVDLAAAEKFIEESLGDESASALHTIEQDPEELSNI